MTLSFRRNTFLRTCIQSSHLSHAESAAAALRGDATFGPVPANEGTRNGTVVSGRHRLQRGIMVANLDLHSSSDPGGVAQHGKDYRASRLHRLAGSPSGRPGLCHRPRPAGANSLVIIDIREPRLYEASHIPGSISIPFSPMSDWAVSDDELLMELPPDEDLFGLLGDWGIGPDSTVVLVGTVEPRPRPRPTPCPTLLGWPRRSSTPVSRTSGSWTEAIPGWAAEGRPADELRSHPPCPGRCAGPVDEGDVRVHRVRQGAPQRRRARRWPGRRPVLRRRPCPFAGVGGHIPTARSLPAPWMWDEDGTYKPVETLQGMAEGVLGPDRDQEIIAYCGVGGYASAWWFVLAQILGYRNVKIYDGVRGGLGQGRCHGLVHLVAGGARAYRSRFRALGRRPGDRRLCCANSGRVVGRDERAPRARRPPDLRVRRLRRALAAGGRGLRPGPRRRWSSIVKILNREKVPFVARGSAPT